MISEKKAIDRLVNKKSKVSSHYFIKRDGTIINMVPENLLHGTRGCHVGKVIKI